MLNENSQQQNNNIRRGSLRQELSSQGHVRAQMSNIFHPMSTEQPLPDLGINRSQMMDTSMFQSFQSQGMSSSQNRTGSALQAHEVMQKFYVFLNEYTMPKRKFKSFGRQFRETQSLQSQNNSQDIKPYLNQLLIIRNGITSNLYLDCENMFEITQYLKLYKLLILQPNYILTLFDFAASKLLRDLHQISEDQDIRVRVVPFNQATTKTMREISTSNILSLTQIQGIVIRMSNISPTLAKGLFACNHCNNTAMVNVQNDRIEEPSTCPECHNKYSYDLKHDRSIFIDRQTIKLQELPEHVPQGETPLSIMLIVHGDLVDQVRPGDRVRVCGILKAEPRKESSMRRAVFALYDNFLDVISFSRVNENEQLKMGPIGDDMGYLGKEQQNCFNRDGEDNKEQIIFTREEEENIHNLSQDPNLYFKLAEAIAPSIFECLDVKKGLLMQLFGAREKSFSQSGRGRFRSEINVLLIGDPSTAKSQLLSFVHKVAPRGIYTAGKSSSAVGLTAYVKRDPQTNQPVLQSGALVLSDRGICCIDEFDKMSENARSVLHQVMEQQTVSIAKSGIVCQLNARAAVLAAANPLHSRYQTHLSVAKNLNLPPSLLSRFDLIYLMLDRQMEESDRQLSKHILSMYTQGAIQYNKKLKQDRGDVDYGMAMEIQSSYNQIQEFEVAIEPKLLCSYISYARNRIKPVLTDSAADYIRQSYLQMRGVGNKENRLTATSRQIESLIRLSEAHAKMRLSDRVEKCDAEEAYRLIKVATMRAATRADGTVDMSSIATGIDENTRKNVNQVVDDVKKIMKEHQAEFRIGVKYATLRDYLISLQESRENRDDVPEDFEIQQCLYILEEIGEVNLLNNRRDPIIKLIMKSQ